MAITDRDPSAPDPRWWVRLGWLAAIWVLSIAALGLVAMVIRLWLR